MRRPSKRPQGAGAAFLWDLLTFERMVTGTAVHLVYWTGLALLVLGVFGVLGGAVGVAIRDPFPFGLLMAVPVVVGGLLVLAALTLLWRSFCEFYVAVFKISEDLTALRKDAEAERARLGDGPAP